MFKDHLGVKTSFLGFQIIVIRFVKKFCPKKVVGLTFVQIKALNFSIFGPIIVLHDPFWGLNIVLMLQGYHHSIRREILPKNGGLTFLLTRILEFRLFIEPLFDHFIGC